MRLALFYIIVTTLTFASCKNSESSNINQSPFKEIGSAESGINFANTLTDTDSFNIIEYLYYYNGGGVAVGDINNDGLEDVYFCGNQVGDKLYLNKGKLAFDDITEKAKLDTRKTWSTGVSMEDINHDGFLDIYVSKVSIINQDKSIHNLLYINNKNGTFTEKSHEYGLDFRGLSTQAAFLDYDRDGDLDMYLLNHNIHSVNSYGKIEKRYEVDPFAGDRLYENKVKETGKFEDVSKSAGIYSSPLGYGLAVTVSDINKDGYPDIYVGNDFHENDYLYLNQGNKTFKESIHESTSHTSQFSMGVDIADVNNDGWNDIFTTDMMPYDEEVLLKSAGEDADHIKMIKKDLGFELQNARNHFQVNNQDGTFSDIAYMTKTFATDWSWSVLLQDFNNDRKQDIFISNGIVKRPNDLDYIHFLNEIDSKSNISLSERTKSLIAKMPSQPLSNILFTQSGELEFQKLNVGVPSFSTGAAYADFDKDGDLDIVTNNINAKASLLENTTSKKSYINLSLASDSALVHGSKVTVYVKGEQLYKENYSTRGFMSASSHNMHFGLGDATVIDSIIVIWPDSKSQKWTNVKLNQALTLQRSNEIQDYTFLKLKTNTTIRPLVYTHSENNYQDYNAEKLIPEKLSFEGPAIIHEDLNNDGIKDIYLGGGRNQPARLLIGTRDGKYVFKPTKDFEFDAKYEDIDAATLDFDKDGDRDIYVVSGGSDNKELDKLLEDRLYLNNGNGVFKRIPISLPHTNGSCVSITDYDNDGYDDIFVGARSIPGSYGLSPYSFILKNLKGTGVDIGKQVRYGMVTDGQWSDLDGDKDMDLVICGDWMEVAIIMNENGEMVERTKEWGLDTILGLWNTIEINDFNGDGIKDILAGNAGTNHKWTASTNLPVHMYVGDFDNNGEPEPLIFYNYLQKYIPFYPLPKLSTQVPVLKKTFTSYTSSAKVSKIDDLFPNYKENLVEHRRITEMRSMLFLSNGKKYKPIPLSKDHQRCDIQDFVIGDAGEVFYVSGARYYVSELGGTYAHHGRSLGKYDKSKQTFVNGQNFSLPLHIRPRVIKQTQGNTFIIANNNGELMSVKVGS
jgi:enediyne biosynthesis protein E4